MYSLLILSGSLLHIQLWKLLQVDICHLKHLCGQLAPDLGKLVVPGREAPWKYRHRAAVQHPKHLRKRRIFFSFKHEKQ